MAESKKTLRVPPQNIESEKALLGCLMLKQDSIYDVVDRVPAHAFYVEKHRLIYQAMLDLFSKNEDRKSVV